MAKKVVLVGHCGADSAYMRIAVNSASKDATVATAHDDASLNKLIEEGAELILLNRQLDYGFSTEEGVELIKSLRTKYPNLKTMLVTNYPEIQQEAIRAGALPGFGKRELGTPRVKELLREALNADDKVTR